MGFRKVLCPLDLSPASPGVLNAALRFARAMQASVTLVHVVEPMYPPEGEALARYKGDAERLAPGVRVEVAELEGTAWRRLVDLAESDGFDFIVMGTRGRTGIKHLLGSVAERVVRHAACPVLVVRGEKEGDAPLFNSILCAVDLSEPSRAAMRTAVELAGAFAASLALLHVYESPIYVEPPPTVPPAVEKDMLASKRLLAAWQEDARRMGAPDVRMVWIEGITPWHEIVRRAEEYGHDLVVLGTHGRTGLKHAFIGSVAERVVRHAACPVLTVRKPPRRS